MSLNPMVLTVRSGLWAKPAGVCCNVERYTKADQACALAAAAAHDLNNELTVILSSISTVIKALEPEDPAYHQALEVQQAARRCAQKASGLLRYGVKPGSRAARTSLQRLLDGE